jgi:hypothetical protein
MASLPQGSRVLGTDPNGSWILYETPHGAQQIRFCAREAWFPSEPTPTLNDTINTSATIFPDGRVVVMEGLHRTRAVARQRVMMDPDNGGVELAPGWLDFSHDPATFRDTPSNQAIMELLGSDPKGLLVPAR